MKAQHSPFPSEGLQPKSETGVDTFLRRYPEFDGRGIVVGIFDTGCDPGAPGLQETPTGAKKMINFVDTTGSGDVAMSQEVSPDGKGQLAGASGRKLKPDPSWDCPSNKFRLGVKRAFQLFPKGLVSRLKAKRQKKLAEFYRSEEARLRNLLESEQASAAIAPKSGGAGEPVKLSKDDVKAELQARLAEVVACRKGHRDEGPLLDVVSFLDSKGVTRVCVRGGEGEVVDLKGSAPLADFKLEQQHGTFSGVDMMNYSVSVEDGGDCVSLVTTAGAHGTHVAGIVGGYFPGQPELNGIAPGCQMVSIKIGDSRLGSMETGTGLVRGLLAALRNGCDLVNMSYGEPASTANRGRFCSLAAELVKRHKIIFVASAGNSGPALTTVGAPGGTTDGLIGVGAFVSQSMMKACHSLPQNANDQQFTWSSRGPTSDGALGVCISACGGAISPVPNWCLQKNQLMNGTSMSSPAACGALALVLSGLKHDQTPYSPAGIRRALQATAKTVASVERFAIGAGLLQVLPCFLHCQNAPRFLDHHVKYQARVLGKGSGGAWQRGVYLRSARDGQRAHALSLSLQPVFPVAEESDDDAAARRGGGGFGGFRACANLTEAVQELKQKVGQAAAHGSGDSTVGDDEPDSDDENEAQGGAAALPAAAAVFHPQRMDRGGFYSTQQINAQKVLFNKRIELTCTAKWVQLPGHVLLPAQGRSVDLNVDPTSLPPGLHFAEVEGFDSLHPDRGPLFRLPITVLKPSPPAAAAAADGGGSSVDPSKYRFPSLAMAPGRIARRFLVVPNGATWADFTVRTGAEGDIDTSRLFYLHCIYLKDGFPFRETQMKKLIRMGPSSSKTFSMDVEEGFTLDVTLAQYWSSVGNCTADLDVDFHGIVADHGTAGTGLRLSDSITRIGVRSFLQQETLDPSFELTTLQERVASHASQIHSLVYPRDTFPGGYATYKLILHYKWEATEDGKKLTVRAPFLNGFLYESEFEAQMWLLFDSNSKQVGSGDCWPDSVPVSKGKYTLTLQIRHPSYETLEKLKGMVAVFETPLSKAIALPVHSSYASATTRASSSSFGLLPKGGSATLFLSSLPAKKMPKHAPLGSILAGKASFGKKNSGASFQQGSGRRPGRLVVSPKSKDTGKPTQKPAANDTATAADKKGASANGEKTSKVKFNAKPIKGGEEAKEKKEGAMEAKEEEDSDANQEKDYEKELKKMHLAYIAKLKGKDKLVDGKVASKKEAKTARLAFQRLMGALLDKEPQDTELRHAKLHHLYARLDLPLGEADEERPGVRAALEDIVVAATSVVKAVDGDKIATGFGRQLAPDATEEAKKDRKALEESKSRLTDALLLKAAAQRELAKLSKDEDAKTCAEAFHSTLKELSAWLDLGKVKEKDSVAVKSLWVRCFQHETKHEIGACLKILRAHGKEAKAGGGVKLSKLIKRERIRYLRLLGHEMLADWEADLMRADFPAQRDFLY